MFPEEGESIRSYISRWTNVHNTAEGVSEERAIDAFIAGVTREDLKEELGCIGPSTTTHLMEIANKWAKGEDSVCRDHTRPREDDYEDDTRHQDDPDRRRDRDRRRKRRNQGYDNVLGAELVAAGFDKRPPNPRVTEDRSTGYRTSGF